MRLRRGTVGRFAAALAAAAMVATGVVSVSASTHASSGGVVTWAEQPNVYPTYILPLLAAPQESNSNLYQFDNQLYLPLYWFGDNGKALLNSGLSVAQPPVYSDNDTVVTINLKHWQWSNGKPITARDVIFWMNLVSAVTDPNAPTVSTNSGAGPSWAGAVPGAFPQNIVSYGQTGTYSLKLTLNRSYNPTWYTYNELSQIYPMPQQSWDELSASGPIGDYDTSAASRVLLSGPSTPATCTPTAQCYVPSNPGTATSGALGVAQFLNVQSQDISTYDSDPLWKVVDGPFQLARFLTSGYVKLVPNKAYSGSPKPTISAFEELPFTSDSAEFNALRTGSLTIGYIPTQDLGQAKSLERSEHYKLSEWPAFGITYIPFNFTNHTSGPIFRQLYFRQAFQTLINQKEYIKQFQHGYGTVDNGPVPTYPRGYKFTSPLEAKGEVYAYSPSKAVSLLKSHGWHVVPGGVSYCQKPGSGRGDCGAGIKDHQQLSFGLLYSSGTEELTNEMEAMQSAMKAKAGISLTLKSASTSSVASVELAGCTMAKPCNTWDLSDIALSFTWTFGPDFFPSGEQLFYTGAGPDAGGYSSTVNDANINATITSSAAAEKAAMFKYEDYLAKQLPVAWVPNGDIQLTMYKNNLKGIVPQDVLDIIYPQDYRLSK
ncbi:MAG: ABC transporter substrate-binding protein [Candidatus Dormibacteria bacterium]